MASHDSTAPHFVVGGVRHDGRCVNAKITDTADSQARRDLPLPLRSLRTGPVVVIDAGIELFAQGSLRVHRRPGGFVVFVDQRAAAFVDEGTQTVDAVVADDDARDVLEAVVLVAARAIVERLRGRFHVHAGLVVDDRGRGTLIGGVGGAGKTTTTLALAQAGLALAGDDVGFLSSPAADGCVTVQALPRPLHLGDATLAMFPALLAHVRPDVRTLAGKRVVDVGLALRDPVPVARLLFPTIGSVPTHATRLSASDVLPRLLFASASVAWPSLPGAAEHLATLRALAEVPSWAVVLGPDALAAPQLIVAAVG